MTLSASQSRSNSDGTSRPYHLAGPQLPGRLCPELPHTCRSQYPSGWAQLGGNPSFSISLAGDAHALKAVIHCLKPPQPTLRLFPRCRWQVERHGDILVRGSAAPRRRGSPHGRSCVATEFGPLDAGQSARASLPVPARACFDRLLLLLGTICRCESRSEARSCPRNRRESGECRINAALVGFEAETAPRDRPRRAIAVTQRHQRVRRLEDYGFRHRVKASVVHQVNRDLGRDVDQPQAVRIGVVGAKRPIISGAVRESGNLALPAGRPGSWRVIP
jgi:hypothetical protein